MNPSNPFQIPSCFQVSEQQRRRERFKKGVITAVALLIALLVGLLIQGCVSEHSQAGTPDSAANQPAAAPEASKAQSPVILQFQPKPAATSTAVPARPVTLTTPVVPPPTAVAYTVERGDTLGRIARTHGTTVKAIQAANGLATDRIVIGEKLKLPAA